MKFKALLLALALTLPIYAQQPQSQTAPISPLNAKYANGVAPGYAPTIATGLVVNISGGTAFCGGTIAQYAGGTLTLTASATNNVYLNTASSCIPASKTSSFTTSDVPLAIITTSGSAITGITDVRTPFSFGTASAGNPGGSNGQAQWNNNGVFAGFTVSGDCTLTTSSGAIVCTKTNGVSFAASATIDATNASNISSGTLGCGRLPALTGQVTTSIGSCTTSFSGFSGLTPGDYVLVGTSPTLGNGHLSESGGFVVSSIPFKVNSTTDSSQDNYVPNGVSPTVPASGAAIGVNATVTTPSYLMLPDAPCSGTLTVTNASGIMTITCTTLVADVAIALTTSSVGANACETSAHTQSMPGVTTSMSFIFTPTGDMAAITGWGPVTPGLWIDAWPTSNTLNWKVCNNSTSPITPGALSVNVGAK